MAKRIVGTKSGIKNPRLMHPSREWWIGLCMAVALFSAIAVWSTQTYAQYRNDALSSDSIDEVRPTVYRKSLVESVLEEFDLKADLHTTYLASQAMVPEVEIPALPAEEGATSTEAVGIEENIDDTQENINISNEGNVAMDDETEVPTQAPQDIPATSSEEEIGIRSEGGNFEAN